MIIYSILVYTIYFLKLQIIEEKGDRGDRGDRV